MRSSRSLEPYLPVEILETEGSPTLVSSGALIMAELILPAPILKGLLEEIPLPLPVFLAGINNSLLCKFWTFNGDSFIIIPGRRRYTKFLMLAACQSCACVLVSGRALGDSRAGCNLILNPLPEYVRDLYGTPGRSPIGAKLAVG